MYCKNCGSPLDSDSKFCSNCGNQMIHEDLGNKKYYYLGTFVPILALILGFLWKDKKPIASKQIRIGGIFFLMSVGTLIASIMIRSSLIKLLWIIGMVYFSNKMVKKVNEERDAKISKVHVMTDENNSINYPRSLMGKNEKISLIGASFCGLLSFGLIGIYGVMWLLSAFVYLLFCPNKGESRFLDGGQCAERLSESVVSFEFYMNTSVSSRTHIPLYIPFIILCIGAVVFILLYKKFKRDRLGALK